MKKVILCILDGYGLRNKKEGNAILAAKTPNFDRLWKMYPHSKLVACGEKVGLPKGQMGNSEVGHMNIGAGRIVDQPLRIIDKAIADKSFYSNEEILEVINHAKENESKLHILGLLSDGGVHSHINHIMTLVSMAKKENIKELYLHLFLDGRDTLKDDGLKFINKIEKHLKKEQLGKIATLSGRFYAMDRDKRWNRLKKAYDAIVRGDNLTDLTIKETISNSYNEEIYDEFYLPRTFDIEGKIESNDGIIFANFRPDRATEILTALTNRSFRDFEVENLKNIKLVTMMPCAKTVIGKNAFSEHDLKNTLGDYVSRNNAKQLRIAETEKYAHVTYFFDGGKDEIFPRAKRILVPSDREVLTYDMKPEMSAYEILGHLKEELPQNYDMVIINFANCDMVGHTGNFEAAVKAVEAVDNCLGEVYKLAVDNEYTLLVTADHGNADYMLDKGVVITSHSMAKVPFIVCEKGLKVKNGKLGDIAPTLLKLMQLDKPAEMKGVSLIGK